MSALPERSPSSAPVAFDPQLAARVIADQRRYLPDSFESSAARISEWMENLKSSTAALATPFGELSLPRLNRYFPASHLQSVSVVVPPEMPVLPLAEFGFQGKLPDAFVGFTIGTTYLIGPGYLGREGIHFHELIHTVQWKILGAEAFVVAYAAGLSRHGYRNALLEDMAYELQSDFENYYSPVDAAARVKSYLERAYAGS
ncbi:MAG: hypothetical protein K1X83_13990 [Oligoflexia bacterium]|nr:hypothetical protein [Oligoflexia bacterium]